MYVKKTTICQHLTAQFSNYKNKLPICSTHAKSNCENSQQILILQEKNCIVINLLSSC